MEIIVRLCDPDEIPSLTCRIKLYLLALSISVLQEIVMIKQRCLIEWDS